MNRSPNKPRNWKPGPFDHQRLDVYHVARGALAAGDQICRGLPRGHGKLADQLRRSLLSALLNIAEAASRDGADRRARFRIARGEAAEAAAAVDAVQLLALASTARTEALLDDLARLCAMLTRLAGRR